MSDNLENLLGFLTRLDAAKIHYSLECNRDEAVMVIAVVPGERWEIEFFPDGHVEVEVFRSDGKIRDERLLEDFFARHSD